MASVVDNNPNSPFFSEEAKDIVISGITAVKVTLSLLRPNHPTAILEMSPYGGKIIIPLKEILRGVLKKDIPSDALSLESLSTVTIRLVADTEHVFSCTYQVVPGTRDFANPDYNDSSDFFQANILTTRFEREASTHTVLYLGGIAVDTRDPESTSDSLSTVMYGSVDFRTGNTHALTHAFINFPMSASPYPGHAESYCKKITFDEIRSKIEALGHRNPEILNIGLSVVAFDDRSEESIWGTSTVDFAFINPSINHTEFLFRNAYGSLDFIEARGSVSPVSEFERQTFINGGIETMASNDTRRKFSINTGRLFDYRECLQWQEFFESDIHYVLDNRGDTHRIIIDEVKTNMLLKGNSTASFVFHFADKYNDKFINI